MLSPSQARILDWVSTHWAEHFLKTDSTPEILVSQPQQDTPTSFRLWIGPDELLFFRRPLGIVSDAAWVKSAHKLADAHIAACGSLPEPRPCQKVCFYIHSDDMIDVVGDEGDEVDVALKFSSLPRDALGALDIPKAVEALAASIARSSAGSVNIIYIPSCDTIPAALLDSFRSYATSLGPDVEVAVTSTDADDPSAHCGSGDCTLSSLYVREGTLCASRPCPFSCASRLQHLCTLLVSLLMSGHSGPANAALNKYMDVTMAYEELRLLRVHLASACLHAHAQCASVSPTSSSSFLSLACACVSPPSLIPPPLLLAVGGCAGHGKLAVAKAMATVCPGICGAIVLKSETARRHDVMAPGQPLAKGLTGYSYEATDAAYTALTELGIRIVREWQCSVVIDGTFLKPKRRNDIRRAAAACGIPFVGLWVGPVTSRPLMAGFPPRAGDTDAAAAVDPKVGVVDWVKVPSLPGEPTALPFSNASALARRVLSTLGPELASAFGAV